MVCDGVERGGKGEAAGRVRDGLARGSPSLVYVVTASGFFDLSFRVQYEYQLKTIAGFYFIQKW